MNTLDKLNDKSATIGSVGLGYVGLPLLIGYAEKGIKVIGYDIDQGKIDAILKGKSYIEHIDGAPLAKSVEAGLVDATSDFSREF